MKRLFFLSVIILFASVLKAQHSKPDSLIAHFTDEKITIDGKFDESCWKEAMKISNFTQRELYEGEPATEKTQIAVVYN